MSGFNCHDDICPRAAAKRKLYIKTNAVITNPYDEWINDGDSNTLRTTYHIDYTAEGKSYRHVGGTVFRSGFRSGKQIEIFCNPDDPLGEEMELFCEL